MSCLVDKIPHALSNRVLCPICSKTLSKCGDVSRSCLTQENIWLKANDGLFPHPQHYTLTLVNDDVVFCERLIIYPFKIDSYALPKVSNIYRYGCGWRYPHFVAEVPYLDLPWSDKAKILNKLKMYTVFS